MLKTITLAVFALVGCAAPSGLVLVEEQENHKPDPRTLVVKVVKTYRAIKTYQDTGVVENSMNQETNKYRFTTPFSIAFKRPGRLRFEWTGTMPGGQTDHQVLSCDGQRTYSYWEHLQQYKREPDLQMGIGAATGVSGGAAHTIPGLLLERPAWGHNVLFVLSNLVLLPEETFEGVPCYVLGGRHLAGMECKFWIGRDDYLIRKMEQATASLGVSRTERLIRWARRTRQEQTNDASMLTREIHRDIVIDMQIPDEFFRFAPPEGARLVQQFEAYP